jgi:pSer/pThr/pTyr-binding forkhead associated (FHA) protein
VESPLAPHRATPEELRARLEAERLDAPFLVWRDGDGAQRIRSLDGAERVTIGRREENDVALAWDTEVSRLHAVVERVGGEWTVVDDGLSQNGTFVAGERLAGRRRLADGDLVRTGRSVIAFVDPHRGASAATSIAGDAHAMLELTTMQKRVLVALCRPFADTSAFAAPATNQQIAGELYLSVDGVKTHLRTLFRKFAVPDLPHNQKRLQLAQRAMDAGIVTHRELR